MLVRSKLNSIESKISEALINNEISHEDYLTIIKEEKKYRKFKESIRMMNSQRRNVEKNRGQKKKIILKIKKIGINVLMKLLSAMKLLITV